jgi:hypothetical protein
MDFNMQEKYLIINRSSLLGEVDGRRSLQAFLDLKERYDERCGSICGFFGKPSVYVSFLWLNRPGGAIEQYKKGRIGKEAFITDYLLYHCNFLVDIPVLSLERKKELVVECWNAMIVFDETKVQWLRQFQRHNPDVHVILINNTNPEHDEYINEQFSKTLGPISPESVTDFSPQASLSYLPSYLSDMYKTEGLIAKVIEKIKGNNPNAQIAMFSAYEPDLECARTLHAGVYQTGGEKAWDLRNISKFGDLHLGPRVLQTASIG